MTTLYAVSNFGITLGYLFLAIAVAPYIDVRRKWVKWAGAVFFLTCGFTHADMAIYALLGQHHPITAYGLANHALQAVAVWTFVYGLYQEFVVDRRSSK